MSEENISLPVAQALASALEKIEAYVPTEYVDNSEPDIDAEHLNHAEQGIMRVTNLLNAAVDVIQGQESRLEDTETKVGTAALTGGMTDLSSGVNSLYSNLTPYIGIIKDSTNNFKPWLALKENIDNLPTYNKPFSCIIKSGYEYFCIGHIYQDKHFGAFLITYVEGGGWIVSLREGQWSYKTLNVQNSISF